MTATMIGCSGCMDLGSYAAHPGELGADHLCGLTGRGFSNRCELPHA